MFLNNYISIIRSLQSKYSFPKEGYYNNSCDIGEELGKRNPTLVGQ